METREEKEARHARKAANVQAHRSKIRAQLSRQSTLEKVKGPTQFHCPLVFDNACVCFEACPPAHFLIFWLQPQNA